MADELSRLHRFIITHYDREELRTLCMELGVDYDSLPGEGKAAKSRELVLYLARRKELAPLVNALRRGRPGAFDDVKLGVADGLDALYAALPAYEADSVPPRQQAAGHHIAQADRRGVSVVGDGNIIVTGGAQVAIGDRARSSRDLELAYLDELLARYEFWRDHYTPLAGIAEVRAAVQDGPRLDLPMPFIPPGFERLVEHGYGGRVELKREPVDDLRAAVAAHRRIVLLGEPGSGKTTTLWRLAYDYALAAGDDEGAPLPVLVPLGGYDEGPFDAFIARHLGPLAAHLDAYRASGRLALLLDGLNEMPQVGYAGRVGRIRETLGRGAGEIVVVSCRALDYVVRLEGLQKVEIAPLNEGRIQEFVCNYLGPAAGERLFWAMAGDEVRALWETWQGAGGAWDEFWTAEEMPKNVYSRTTGTQDQLWKSLRESPPPLLALGRNPYLLLMTAQVYAGAGGELPANRARLFAAFVDTLLGRERKRHARGWIDAERQQDGLSALAFAMQTEGARGTTVSRVWALERLAGAVPDEDAERLLHLATSATLLDAGEETVRFYHQLLQEYFAARELGRRVDAGEALTGYWPPGSWWEPSGWEETAILLAGMQADCSSLLGKLASVNPVVAARCLVDGGVQAGEQARRNIADELIARMTTTSQPPVARAQAGVTLARLGDPRREVLEPAAMEFCDVPAGPFWMGSSDEDDMAYDDEKPLHRLEFPYDYWLARYPVTVAQFRAFVQASGIQPGHAGSLSGPDNCPVVYVDWHEARAFCAWLTESWQAEGVLPPNWEVRLPSEAEWEKAARGGIEIPSTPLIVSAEHGLAARIAAPALIPNPIPQRRYPWGDDPDPNRANYDASQIGSVSAVGCFPGGASPYGCLDMSGNVWEWTRSLWEPDAGTEFKYPYDPTDGRENLEAGDRARRVLRGAAFFNTQRDVRCAYRTHTDPDYRNYHIGFRVLAAPFSLPYLRSGTRLSGALGNPPSGASAASAQI